jgi:replicative DNA helicase
MVYDKNDIRNAVDSTYQIIRDGQKGLKPYISTQLAKLDDTIYGIKQGTTYLIGGDTGTGKSSLCRGTFIHGPYEQYLQTNDESKLDVLFVDYSLEISKQLNMATAMSRKIFLDTGKVLPVGKLMGWTPDKLTPEELQIVENYKPYFEAFSKKLIVIDDDVSATQFHDALFDIAKSVGKFKTEGRWITDCGEYTPNNPNLVVIVLFDTLNLAELEQRYSTIKAAIDRISKTGIKFRNKCNFVLVEVQQFNSDINSTERNRFGQLSPTLKDFMDSSGPTKDATIVMGMYCPARYFKEDQPLFKKYDISKLKNWFVSIHILKNRYGASMRYVPCKFDGAVGVFTQLPEPDKMTPEEYFKATNH